MIHLGEEHLDTKLKDLILPRIGYLFAFIDDYNQCRKQGEAYTATEGVSEANVSELFQKIIEHIYEHVGHMTVRQAHESEIPDYKHKVTFDRGGEEEVVTFNFFVTWDEDSQHIEIEYDGYRSTKN